MMTKDAFRKLFPEEKLRAYDLGKHWPEAGDWQTWLAGKLADFKKHYEYLGHETASTNSGGTLLMAYGIPRKHFDGLMAGTECFLYPCSPHVSFTDPADLAIHLVDRHEWATDKAAAWLREKVESKAFADEP